MAPKVGAMAFETPRSARGLNRFVEFYKRKEEEFTKERECPICGNKLNRKLIKKSI